MDRKELADAFAEIGDELLSTELLTPSEREKVAAWTAGMGLALTMGEAQKVKNYRASLGAMLGVVELRAAAASEKALLRVANLGLEILTKLALAALV